MLTMLSAEWLILMGMVLLGFWILVFFVGDGLIDFQGCWVRVLFIGVAIALHAAVCLAVGLRDIVFVESRFPLSRQ